MNVLTPTLVGIILFVNATCFAGKVCGPVQSTWGNSLGEDKLGARARILNTKVARRARTGQLLPQVGKYFYSTAPDAPSSQ